jgi:hypothetical protein
VLHLGDTHDAKDLGSVISEAPLWASRMCKDIPSPPYLPTVLSAQSKCCSRDKATQGESNYDTSGKSSAFELVWGPGCVSITRHTLLNDEIQKDV